MSYKNTITHTLLFITLCLQYMNPSLVSAESLPVECSTTLNALMGCLEFSTGKAADPTKQCCSEVSSMKKTKPVCLCYFIAETYNGTSPQIKELGVQVTKLIQLPSACHLANSSISQCPQLLGISPSSPAAAIFTHTNTTGPTSSSSTSSPGGVDSSGFKHEFGLFGGFIIGFVTTFLCSPLF
ncbi:hypothetical protein RND81_11G005200 [Saponaria officinalis]|uniref:Bifunctional inhibitor/plant lipid transfer protein/seed storage helical domain-containing protein n=1 Tax=Saponaria officinalis TaxID=3572 RepID=A0AAW1HH51_SAPOF